jgi:hypothetical protein
VNHLYPIFLASRNSITFFSRIFIQNFTKNLQKATAKTTSDRKQRFLSRKANFLLVEKYFEDKIEIRKGKNMKKKVWVAGLFLA